MYYFYYEDDQPTSKAPSFGRRVLAQLREDFFDLLFVCSLGVAAIILWDLW